MSDESIAVVPSGSFGFKGEVLWKGFFRFFDVLPGFLRADGGSEGVKATGMGGVDGAVAMEKDGAMKRGDGEDEAGDDDSVFSLVLLSKMSASLPASSA